ncbi:NUDIX domain-containing protein [Terasakiella sp. SH-1]|uniref:NUDIX domain-containing protein n=1 Tax=Terasakiella sp. SH-1 TaxID=2560057 RepID=UPI001073F0F0|nr:NUDIX domain-containing protein [Terasakiella sp. SH-1]
MAKSNSDHTEFNQDDVEVLSKETPFKNYFQVDKYVMRHKVHEGGWSEPLMREIFERGHAVAILPYDPVEDVLILIEQFRPGAFAAGYNPWLLEIPAGIIDEGQTPEDVARRETHEETGCTAKRVEFIMDYLVTPGGSTESMHLFCVEISIDEAVEFAGLEHEGEDIRVLKVPLKEALAKLSCGQVHNSMSIIALQWLQLNHHNIRKKWCK